MKDISLYDFVNVSFEVFVSEKWCNFEYSGFVMDNESGKLVIIYVHFRYNTMGYPVIVWNKIDNVLIYHSESNEIYHKNYKNYKIDKIVDIEKCYHYDTLLNGLPKSILYSYNKLIKNSDKI